MLAIVFLSIALASYSSNAFTIPNIAFSIKSSSHHRQIVKMSDSEPKGNYEIVPIDKTNIESAASFTGGILGFVLLGPVGGVALAALVNYVSKKDNEAGEALRGLGKTVIESVNYFKKVDSKFKLTEKVTETVTKTVESITPQSETVDNVKSTFSSAINKIKEVDTEYDLVAKGKEVIGIAGSLSDAALEKVDELNQKYDFVNWTKKTAKSVVDKLKDQTSK